MPHPIVGLFLLLAVSIPLVATAGDMPAPVPRPNIILILADDLGYGDLGIFHQNQRAEEGKLPSHRTPNLDLLAAGGVTLPNHYSAAPVCAPARASLLTGLHQGHAGVRDNQFDKALETNHNLATVLKAAGYATSCIGKWGLAGNAPAYPGHPLDHGFDDYFGGLRHRDGHEHYPKERPYRGPIEIVENRTNITSSLDDLIGFRTTIASNESDFEIFDIVKDPQQSTNIAASHPDFQVELKQEALRNRRPLTGAPRPYDTTLVPSVTFVKPDFGTLDYAVYQGKWPWLPTFESLVPIPKGRGTSLDPADPARAGAHGLRLSGYFHAPVDGEYTFYVSSPESCQLRIHEALVIDNDFNRTTDPLKATILLQAGFHPIRFDSLQLDGRVSPLHFACAPPNRLRIPIIGSNLCATNAP